MDWVLEGMERSEWAERRHECISSSFPASGLWMQYAQLCHTPATETSLQGLMGNCELK